MSDYNDLKFKPGDKVVHWRGATRKVTAVRHVEDGFQYEAVLVDNPNGCHHAALLVEWADAFEKRYKKVEPLSANQAVSKLTHDELAAIVRDLAAVAFGPNDDAVVHRLTSGSEMNPPVWLSLRPLKRAMKGQS